MTLATFVALCSGALSKPIQQQMVVLGSMKPRRQHCAGREPRRDASGGIRRWRQAHPAADGELFAKFQTGFYADATDAVFKALGVS
jgi:ATP-dependent Lon protease